MKTSSNVSLKRTKVVNATLERGQAALPNCELPYDLLGFHTVYLVRCYEHLRHSPWIKGFTKGLTVTSVGLILAAVIQIARDALTQPTAWVVLFATLIMTQLL